jgi:hypothetical protein
MDMKLFGKKVNVEGLIAILILLFVIFLFTNSSWMMSKEGFDNNKLTEDGAPIGYYGQQDLPNSWINKELTLNGNKGYNQILGLHKGIKGTKVPLEPGNLFFFRDNTFSPFCPGSQYSSSMGYACTSVDQLKYLNRRGGNRTFPTEY